MNFEYQEEEKKEEQKAPKGGELLTGHWMHQSEER
jgi:hypothetical protein